MTNITTILSQYDYFPVMGEKLTLDNAVYLNFTKSNTELKTVDWRDTLAFSAYVAHALDRAGKKYGIGGYLEDREIYRRSEVFGRPDGKLRSIHLGVDIWAKAGSKVFAPTEGVVHSFQDNRGFGNYGPTILLEHTLGNTKFYTLYGHLERKDLENLQVGQFIPEGMGFCHVGPFPENGDWPPHLHFQIIKDLWGKTGDFPGVCAPAETDRYQQNCPDPNLILQYT